MFGKMLCAVAVLGIAFGVAAGDTIKGRITKIDGSKITVQTFDKATKTLGEPKEYVVDTKVKVSKMIKKNQTEAVDGGLQADAFKDLGKRGLAAVVTVEENKVTEIVLARGKGKKKKNNNE